MALAASRELDVEVLKSKTKLSEKGFLVFVSWLQSERLVDTISNQHGLRAKESLILTERGNKLLMALLEGMCELPESR
jgi:hypothetical protein